MKTQDDAFAEANLIVQKAGELRVQWKGTRVCGDAECYCGAMLHVCCDEFAYFIVCPDCHREFALNAIVKLVEYDPKTRNVEQCEPCVPESW